MSLETFKNFVRTKPNLQNYVKNKEMTWQDFYNMYELYGDDNSIWDKYLNNEPTKTITLKDMFGYIKNVDMTEVQNTVTSLQKGIGYIEDLVKTKEVPVRKSTYEARPLYRYFDD